MTSHGKLIDIDIDISIEIDISKNHWTEAIVNCIWDIASNPIVSHWRQTNGCFCYQNPIACTVILSVMFVFVYLFFMYWRLHKTKVREIKKYIAKINMQYRK